MENNLQKANDDLTLVERFNKPSPKLFKTLFKVGGILGVIGTTLVAIPLPHSAVVGGVLIALGTGISSVAKLTVE